MRIRLQYDLERVFERVECLAISFSFPRAYLSSIGPFPTQEYFRSNNTNKDDGKSREKLAEASWSLERTLELGNVDISNIFSFARSYGASSIDLSIINIHRC